MHRKTFKVIQGNSSLSCPDARAVISNSPPSGNDLRAYFRGRGSAVSQAYLDSVEKSAQNDQALACQH